MSLSLDQRRRYAKNIVVEGVGEEGQQRLRDARVVIIGAGGLGSPVALYLAAAGVGHLTLVDHDRVELSNLQRQIAFETGDIGHFKALAAKERLTELNPDIHVTAITERVVEAHCLGQSVIVDCCDNFETRYLLNSFHLSLRVPLVSGAVAGWQGQAMAFTGWLSDAPCFRCFCPEAPERGSDCTHNGTLGAVCGVIGSLQAQAVLQLLLASQSDGSGRLIRYNGKAGASPVFHESRIAKDAACSECGA